MFHLKKLARKGLTVRGGRHLKFFLMEDKERCLLYSSYCGCWCPEDARSQGISSAVEKLSWLIRYLSSGLYMFYSNLWNLSSDIWAKPSEMSDMSDDFREHCISSHSIDLVWREYSGCNTIWVHDFNPLRRVDSVTLWRNGCWSTLLVQIMAWCWFG